MIVTIIFIVFYNEQYLSESILTCYSTCATHSSCHFRYLYDNALFCSPREEIVAGFRSRRGKVWLWMLDYAARMKLVKYNNNQWKKKTAFSFVLPFFSCTVPSFVLIFSIISLFFFIFHAIVGV